MKAYKLGYWRTTFGTALVLVAGLLFTYAYSTRTQSREDATDQTLLNAVQAQLQDALEERVDRYAVLLRSLRAGYSAAGQLSRAQLLQWEQELNTRVHHPSLRSLGYARVVPVPALPNYMQALGARNGQALVYRPLGPNIPTTEAVVVDNNTGPIEALGYEISSDATRALGLTAARTLGKPSFSGPFTLREEPTLVYALFMAHEGANNQTVGYFYALLDTAVFFQTVAREFQNQIEFQLTDAGAKGDQLVYTTPQFQTALNQGNETRTFQMALAGRELRIQLVATGAIQEELSQHQSGQNRLLLLLLTLLLTWAWWYLASERHRVNNRAAELTAQNTLLLDAEKKLRLAAELATRDYQALFETVHQQAIVSEADGKGRIVAVNDAFENISGYTRAELLGQDHRILNSGTHPKAFWTEMWRSLHAGRPWRAEVCNQRKDGSSYWVDSMITPFMNDKGRLERCVSVRLDITERVQGALALSVAKEEAENASRYKSQFLANMSHEIRTPMNAVLGMLQLLRTTPLKPAQLDYTHKAENAAKSLLGILNDILDFSKVEAGKMQLDPNPFDLQQLMADLGVVLNTNLGTKKLEILFDIDPRIPAVLVGDELRLKQVLINLAGNAIKFTPQGEVVVQVREAQREGPTHHLAFEVRDTGIGISPENQVDIFEGFRQAEASTSRRFGGTGLGLAISQRLVGLMGGELHLQSTPGVGTVFSFTLPLAAAPAADILATTQKSRALRALVVEDNPVSLVLMGKMLDSLGWKTDRTASCAQAVERVEQRLAEGSPPDVVFLDWDMPVHDGWATQAAIEQVFARHPMAHRPPVWVMVTGYKNDAWDKLPPEQRQKINVYLTKPVTAPVLKQAVLEQLGGLPGFQVAMEPSAPHALAGMSILLVEDNPINQQVAQELLALQGAQVALAGDGQAAVDLLAHPDHGFDLVLMDMQMPVMDGLQATHVIRQILKRSDLPILAMTANAMATDKAACLQAGMNDHVAKPFDLAVLIKTLLQWCPAPASKNHAAQTGVGASRPGSAPATPGDSSWPEGFNTTGALQRLGQNSGLYRRMLTAFAEQLVQTIQHLEPLNDQIAERRKVWHTLKGSALAVGADVLAQCASEAEVGCNPPPHAPPGSYDHSAAERNAYSAMTEVMAALEVWQPSFATDPATPPSAAPPAGEPDAAAIARMLELLERADMEVLEMGDAWSDTHPHLRHDPRWAPVFQCLDDMDFEGAALALKNTNMGAP